jgi:hypothetical protein
MAAIEIEAVTAAPTWSATNSIGPRTMPMVQARTMAVTIAT